MGAVTFSHRGNFNKVELFFNSLLKRDYLNVLDKYGQIGVNALRDATPVDTGLLASSWNYEIVQEEGKTKLIWVNSDIEGGINVAVLVDRGHATKSGTWVPGVNFIDQAIDPVIEQLAREVTTL